MSKYRKTIISTAAGALAIAAVVAWNKRRNESLVQEYPVVLPFSLIRYLGRWYEIARVNAPSEEKIEDSTADFQLNDDGTLKLIYKCYNVEKERWQRNTGKGKVAANYEEGLLKVSFLGPFWFYHYVLDITDDYKYALIGGENKSYVRILSRKKDIPEEVLNRFFEKINALDICTESIHWIKQRDEI